MEIVIAILVALFIWRIVLPALVIGGWFLFAWFRK